MESSHFWVPDSMSPPRLPFMLILSFGNTSLSFFKLFPPFSRFLSSLPSLHRNLVLVTQFPHPLICCSTASIGGDPPSVSLAFSVVAGQRIFELSHLSSGPRLAIPSRNRQRVACLIPTCSSFPRPTSESRPRSHRTRSPPYLSPPHTPGCAVPPAQPHSPRPRRRL